MNQFRLKTFPWQALDYQEIESYKVDGKRYYQTQDGDMPSMTTLLSVLDDGGLEGWRNYVGQEEADRITKEASDRGNSLHDLSEDYLNNKITDRSQIKGKGKVLFNRSKQYLDELDLILGTEVPVYHAQLGYAGRVDAIAYRKARLTTVDHKNARKKFDLKKGYIRRKLFKYYLQTVGYSLAIEHMFGIRPERGMIIAADVENFKSTPFHLTIDDYVDEFMKLIDIYYGRLDAKESMFFKIED